MYPRTKWDCCRRRYNLGRNIAKYISKDFKKFVLLEDAVSSVDGFEYLSEIFLDRAFDLGIRVMKTTDMRVFFND